MRKRTVRVRVRGGGTRRHTFYETRWGPVFSFDGRRPDVGHRARVRARRRQRRQLPARQPVGAVRPRAVGRATCARANRRVQGNPWTNTIAADSAGQRLLRRRVGGPERRRRPAVALLARTIRSRRVLLSQGVILLDGSRTRCRWKNDRDAVAKGIIGPSGPAARDAHGLRRELQRLLLAAERALPARRLPAHHRRRGHAAAAAHAARHDAGRAAAGRHRRPRAARLHARRRCSRSCSATAT